MLPPTEATASVSLGEKPVPHSCREKMLGTRVCFTRESKKGSRLSSGWWEQKAEAGQGCVSAVPSPGALCAQGTAPHQHCCAPGHKQGQGKSVLVLTSRTVSRDSPGQSQHTPVPGSLPSWSR